MTKILILILVVLLIASISYFYLFILKPKNSSSVVSPQNNNLTTNNLPASESTTSAKVASDSAIETRLKFLENTVADLQKQINANKEAFSGKSALKVPLYIPLGSGAVSTSLSWQTSDALQVTIDPFQYPGYSTMQLEMGLRVYQGNGQAFARLYDVDDSQPIQNSDISSTTQDYNWQTSNAFRLPVGSKKYKLQLYTNTTYEASEQNARIKVNF